VVPGEGLIPVLEGSIVIVLPVAAKVRFLDRYRLPQVSWGAVGVIVDTDERPAPNSATQSWVRARFGDCHALVEAWQLDVSFGFLGGTDVWPPRISLSLAGARPRNG
jgi:hypothetical protein